MYRVQKHIYGLIIPFFVSAMLYSMDNTALYIDSVIRHISRFENSEDVQYTVIHKKDPELIRWEFRQNKKTGTITGRVHYTSKYGLDCGSAELPDHYFKHIVQRYNDQYKKS